MKNDYLCPKCKSYLKANNKIIFSAKKQNGKLGLILLSSELGDYNVITHSSYKLEKGEKLEILCPLCHKILSAPDINKNLAMVLMVDEGGNEFEIYFSEIVGEKCTYKIKGGKLKEVYGHDSEKYTNFFGETPGY